MNVDYMVDVFEEGDASSPSGFPTLFSSECPSAKTLARPMVLIPPLQLHAPRLRTAFHGSPRFATKTTPFPGEQET